MFSTETFYRDATYWPFAAAHISTTHAISALSALCDQGADHVPATRHCL